jgi:hypothetical protein
VVIQTRRKTDGTSGLFLRKQNMREIHQGTGRLSFKNAAGNFRSLHGTAR